MTDALDPDEDLLWCDPLPAAASVNSSINVVSYSDQSFRIDSLNFKPCLTGITNNIAPYKIVALIVRVVISKLENSCKICSGFRVAALWATTTRGNNFFNVTWGVFANI
jgi:hypothetical protein